MVNGSNSTNDYRFIRYYLKLIGFITFCLGTVLLFFPGYVSSIFFEYTVDSSRFFISITGSTLIGYSVLNLLAGREKNRHLLEFAIWGNLATLVVASIVTIIYFPRFDSNGWLIMLQHIFFGLGFAICAYRLKRP